MASRLCIWNKVVFSHGSFRLLHLPIMKITEAMGVNVLLCIRSHFGTSKPPDFSKPLLIICDGIFHVAGVAAGRRGRQNAQDSADNLRVNILIQIPIRISIRPKGKYHAGAGIGTPAAFRTLIFIRQKMCSLLCPP